MSDQPQPHPWNKDVQTALDTIRQVIEDVVRNEQHRNDLTHLRNERALDQELVEPLEGDREIWCAFIEIDSFKRLNDSFSYDTANGMLQIVAAHLTFVAERHFLQPTQAFHAHGDEFYLLGDGAEEDDKIQEALELLRTSIAGAHVSVENRDRPMKATVTIGWVRTSALSLEQRTPRGLKRAVEDAVGYGKRKGRNRTERYSESMQKQEVFSERGNCSKCEAAFTMDVAKDKLAPEATLWCPNCGHQQPRPERPQEVDS